MRTTNKLFKNQVQKHIKEAITEDHTLDSLVDKFHTEKYSSPYEQKQNKYDAFKDWMTGLPTGFNIEYTNHGVHETLSSWYKNCGENFDSKKLTQDEANLYYHLVTREFKTLCNKNNIKF
jgi:hypothetical protein